MTINVDKLEIFYESFVFVLHVTKLHQNSNEKVKVGIFFIRMLQEKQTFSYAQKKLG